MSNGEFGGGSSGGGGAGFSWEVIPPELAEETPKKSKIPWVLVAAALLYFVRK
jgi:hypothetical protein